MPTIDEVDVVAGGERLERVVATDASVPAGRSSGERGLVGERDGRRPAAGRLLREQLALRAGRERDDLEGVRVRLEDVERLAPDRAGRAEERDPAAVAVGAALGVSGRKRGHKGHDRCGEEERVDAVEDAAVARDQRAGVLGPGRPLEHGFGEVAGLRGERR